MTQKDEQTDKWQRERLTDTRQTNSDQWIDGQTRTVSRLYDKKSTGDLKVRIRFGEYMTWLGLFSSFEVLVWGWALWEIQICIRDYLYLCEWSCICKMGNLYVCLGLFVFMRRTICIYVRDYLYLCEWSCICKEVNLYLCLGLFVFVRRIICIYVWDYLYLWGG